MTTMTLASTINFKDLFPFHFELDESFLIKSCGPLVLKMEEEIVGKSFKQLFSLLEPKSLSELGFNELRLLEDTLITLENNHSKNSYKGQLIFQEATNSLFFIQTPCLITFSKSTSADTSMHQEIVLGPIFDTLLTKKSLLDLSKLTNLFFDNEEIITKMIQLFVDTTPQINLKLKKAIENENINEIKNLAHQLKPSLDHIALVELSSLAKEIQYTELIDNFFYEKAFVLCLLLKDLINELEMKLKYPL